MTFEEQRDKVLEILKNRGIETYEDVIYSVDEDDKRFIVCIDTNQMIINKRKTTKCPKCGEELRL